MGKKIDEIVDKSKRYLDYKVEQLVPRFKRHPSLAKVVIQTQQKKILAGVALGVLLTIAYKAVQQSSSKPFWKQ